METGSSYYSGGIQPYKTMQTLWYHYDTPKSLFGISLLAMNIGVQNTDMEHSKTFYQQLFGTYMTLKPKFCSLEGAFYYQMGKEEHGIPIDAFMGSVKVNINPSYIYTIYTGYDYLSGDKYFAVPASGEFGLVHHDKIRGFAPLFGSHHDFTVPWTFSTWTAMWATSLRMDHAEHQSHHIFHCLARQEE